MKLNNIKIFKNQPKITNSHIMNLINRGLIAPFVDHAGKPRDYKPGWVVGYPRLTKAISSGEVSQTDARRLMVIEIAATNGKPRQTHIDRLMGACFAEDRAKVIANINSYKS